jgi:hypothetical protein
MEVNWFALITSFQPGRIKDPCHRTIRDELLRIPLEKIE